MKTKYTQASNGDRCTKNKPATAWETLVNLCD
jgi:hypothetical protein